jgi:hypothetical protein
MLYQAISAEDYQHLNGADLLEHYIDIIGMGSYQWKLFLLCGCGWAAE